MLPRGIQPKLYEKKNLIYSNNINLNVHMIIRPASLFTLEGYSDSD